MFSSFDAVCAEMLGQTVRASFPSIAKGSGNTAAGAGIDVSKKQQQGDSIPPSVFVRKNKQQQQEQQRRAPRFAPELDGLNCFETLVSF